MCHYVYPTQKPRVILQQRAREWMCEEFKFSDHPHATYDAGGWAAKNATLGYGIRGVGRSPLPEIRTV